MIFIAQLLGAIVAAAVVSGLFPGPLRVLTRLSGGTSIARGLFIEMFLTAELVFTIFMLAVEKSKATYLAPVGIGIALFICELAGVYYTGMTDSQVWSISELYLTLITGGSLNPARSFGPAVIYPSFDGYHWIYWLGPFFGAILAVLFHRLIKGMSDNKVWVFQAMANCDDQVLNTRTLTLDKTWTIRKQRSFEKIKILEGLLPEIERSMRKGSEP